MEDWLGVREIFFLLFHFSYFQNQNCFYGHLKGDPAKIDITTTRHVFYEFGLSKSSLD